MSTRLIAYTIDSSDGQIIINESTPANLVSDNLDEILAFLTEPFENRDDRNFQVIRAVWDLDDSFAPVIKLLSKAKAKELWENKKCKFGNYDFFYAPSKVFIISTKNRRASFYHLAQYFPDEPYQTDVEQVEMYGRLLVDTLHKMGFYSKKLTSPPKIFEEWVLDHTDLPSVYDMPEEAAEWAYRTSGRLWVEAFMLGKFDDTWDYDLRSSFPSVAAKLFDFRGCEWVRTKEYQPSAIYGYVEGLITVYDWVMVSPIIHIDENGESSSRTGTWSDYINKGSINFLNKWKIGEVKAESGWWAIPKGKKQLTQPLEYIMPRLLANRTKGRLENLLAKKMAVGLYGKTLEEHGDEFGKHFNPVFGSEIGTAPRLEVADFLYRHGTGPGDNEGYKNLIYVAVDGCLLKKEVELTDKDNQWKVEKSGEALALSSNQVWYSDKHPQGLYLNDVLDMLKSHPRMSRYAKTLKRRVTLGQMLESGNWDDLGKEREMSMSVDLRLNTPDRDFDGLPRTGKDLLTKQYSSRPLTLGR